MSAPYRTLFTGLLVQDSALSAGGNSPHALVDDPLCLDGCGRYTLRGTTLAGALVATARKVYSDKRLERISRPPAPGRGTKAGPDSLWRVFTAHPQDDPKPEFRQGVGIRHDTGAAAAGALFDLEVLPRETKWRLIIEVDTVREGGLEAEGVAAHVLQEWAAGRAWIGRNVARGMGWIRLQDLHAYRLDVSHCRLWPNSRQPPERTLQTLEAEHGLKPIPLQEIKPPAFDKSWYYQEIEGTIEVGARTDGYGLDAISIGGHGSGTLTAEWNDAHFQRQQGVDAEHLATNFEPDAAIVLSLAPGGDPEPILPGSALRGPLRHCLARHLRRHYPQEAATVRDPMVDRNPPKTPGPLSCLLEALFGNMERSARLLIRDAHLADDRWRAAWLQQHAEDEFSGGVYGPGKFDRMALLAGTFEWRMVIEGPNRADVIGQAELLEEALAYAKAGHLGIGGQQWRGLGWPRWKVTPAKFQCVGRAEAEA